MHDSPNIILGLLSIHAVISRGLQVAVETSGAFARNGFPDATSREGFICYLRCLVSLLRVHHKTEDTLAFPSFKAMVHAPYDLLEEQHRLLHPMLEEAASEIESLAAAPDPSAPLARLNLVLRSIQGIWHPHIGIEEEHFTIETFESLIPPDEHRWLNRLFLEHTRQHAGPDYLTVPFLLYNLPPDKRGFLTGEMSPEVTGQLVPVVWKEKWAPMQPFLLA